MSRFQYFFALCLILSNSYVFAAEEIIAGDGKQYRLNDDGSWELLSDDRILDTNDGRRVLLKEDGSWQYLGLAPVESKTNFQSTVLAASIADVQIFEIRESVGASKNSRVKYSLILTMDISLDRAAENALSLTDLNEQAFTLSDNTNKSYPIVSVESEQDSLAPGSSTTIRLISNKAPKKLKKLAELQLELAEGTLGNEGNIVLSYDYALVVRKVEKN